MFTGIIESVGSVSSIENKGADSRYTIKTGKLDLSDVSLGDSISVNGVCLTVVELNKDGFITDVSSETLSCTTFESLKTGDKVNLEKALLLSDRLGGHIVSGHVDGIGCIESFHDDGRSVRYLVNVPTELSRYICMKGSICVDGVSLTVNDLQNNSFSINIIPHTSGQTIFSTYRKGTAVNLEVDIIARYLEGLNQ